MGATLPLEIKRLKPICSAMMTWRHGSWWAAAVHQHNAIKGTSLLGASRW